MCAAILRLIEILTLNQGQIKLQKTKLSQYERSLLISQTTVKLFNFEDGPPPVGANMDFNVSIGFLVRAFVALQSYLSKRWKF